MHQRDLARCRRDGQFAGGSSRELFRDRIDMKLVFKSGQRKMGPYVRMPSAIGRVVRITLPDRRREPAEGLVGVRSEIKHTGKPPEFAQGEAEG